MASYSIAQDSWRDSQVIRVFAPDEQFVAEFPMSFVITGGVDLVGYVEDVISLLVEPSSYTSIVAEDGSDLRADGSVRGDNLYIRSDGEFNVSLYLEKKDDLR